MQPIQMPTLQTPDYGAPSRVIAQGVKESGKSLGMGLTEFFKMKDEQKNRTFLASKLLDSIDTMRGTSNNPLRQKYDIGKITTPELEELATITAENNKYYQYMQMLPEEDKALLNPKMNPNTLNPSYTFGAHQQAINKVIENTKNQKLQGEAQKKLQAGTPVKDYTIPEFAVAKPHLEYEQKEKMAKSRLDMQLEKNKMEREKFNLDKQKANDSIKANNKDLLNNVIDNMQTKNYRLKEEIDTLEKKKKDNTDMGIETDDDTLQEIAVLKASYDRQKKDINELIAKEKKFAEIQLGATIPGSLQPIQQTTQTPTPNPVTQTPSLTADQIARAKQALSDPAVPEQQKAKVRALLSQNGVAF